MRNAGHVIRAAKANADLGHYTDADIVDALHDSRLADGTQSGADAMTVLAHEANRRDCLPRWAHGLACEPAASSQAI